ncbi:MAG: hypothetical protein J6Z36_02665, partial [Clostridia bacterium]|nr:hypothetical protein [Clostridia bacterium]
MKNRKNFLRMGGIALLLIFVGSFMVGVAMPGVILRRVRPIFTIIGLVGVAILVAAIVLFLQGLQSTENNTKKRYRQLLELPCKEPDFASELNTIRKNFATPPHDTIVCLGDPLVLAVRGADSCVWSANGGAPFELHDTIVSIVPQELTSYQIKSYITWNGQI